MACSCRMKTVPNPIAIPWFRLDELIEHGVEGNANGMIVRGNHYDALS